MSVQDQAPSMTPERALVPQYIRTLDERLVAQWADLTDRQRSLLTPDAFTRWAEDLHPSDVDLAEIATLERRRQSALRTMRVAHELTDMEFRLLRFLQRHERETLSYLRLARHLWETDRFRVTAAHLRSHGGYAAPMVTGIQVLVFSLRRKIEIDPLRPQHLCNIRGVGYRWYFAPPSHDDGENYEARATESALLRREMQGLIGDVDSTHFDPRVARLIDPELGPEDGVAIEAEFEAVADRVLGDGEVSDG